ncbi:E3 ubiquitin-protein ligase RGLG1-like [Bidens hawaiensis]|uniref:E3 ubiquitin-protein ligase RGLG1-like n=1 Tax=Bidens hawaiensis TaxID=980011 RepID=UPI00404A5B0A
MGEKNKGETSYNPRHHNPPVPQRRFDRRYTRIADNFETLEEAMAALARVGLESSSLIVGFDFTKSNEWTGMKSFHGRSLHSINGVSQNPYEQAISIIGRTLVNFNDDNWIPCYGFGDASTQDKRVFSFYPDCPCRGLEDVLRRYREIVPRVRLAGPTSFAPIIEMAMTIVEKSGCQYHVLLLIADGQVTRSFDPAYDQPSIQEQETIDAIVKASNYPLSIILVGVGDGPWDMMMAFDNLPSRAFDNFKFVNFTEIMSTNMHQPDKEREFALNALMKIPSQYTATIELKLLSARKGDSPGSVPLPPPSGGNVTNANVRQYHVNETRHNTACQKCGADLLYCPTCERLIQAKIVVRE